MNLFDLLKRKKQQVEVMPPIERYQNKQLEEAISSTDVSYLHGIKNDKPDVRIKKLDSFYRDHIRRMTDKQEMILREIVGYYAVTPVPTKKLDRSKLAELMHKRELSSHNRILLQRLIDSGIVIAERRRVYTRDYLPRGSKLIYTMNTSILWACDHVLKALDKKRLNSLETET